MEIHDDWLDQSSDDDTDLCASLLQEPDVEPMDTVSSTNQPPKQVDSPDDVVEPMDTVSSINQLPKQIEGAGDDKITLAFDTLTAAAAELGYSIHDVPRDGNCLFSAIAYQLESWHPNC